MDFTLKKRLETLECHFTWDLGCYKTELQELERKLEDSDQQGIIWMVYNYNLMGYIQQSLGSHTEALMHLLKAESVIQEQGKEEAGARLQVNKANLAWVHFHLGEETESTTYLEEVERLQQMHPAPPGCALHPEVSGEKGWTLLRFNKSKKLQSIDFFKMALKAEPDRKEWHKGLAKAMMNTTYMKSELTPDMNADILEHLKRAKEIDPSDLYLQSLYLFKLSEVQGENDQKEMESLLEKIFNTGNLEGLHYTLRSFENKSIGEVLQKGDRVLEKFPTSTKVLRTVANLYKWKVYSIKEDSKDKQTLVKKSIELFEEVVRHYPDFLKEKIALASLHRYAHNMKRANEIYKELLSEEDDLPPHRRQRLYYSYACHLFHSRLYKDNESTHFYMKAAEIPDNTNDKVKSIKVLENIVRRGKDPRCEEILLFLERIQREEQV